jgi:hypothetical protein
MIQIFSPCPLCGYVGTGEPKAPPNRLVRCKAKATEVPLRCQHAADLGEYLRWNVERYRHTDGKEYLPVTRGRDLNLEATLAGGPIEPPKTIPHLHRTCIVCGEEWVEAIGGE